MKKIINYEKDIQFKTSIGEICSISLEHDFTVGEAVLKGEFIVSGDYKANSLSLNKEAFSYHLPLEYELDKTCDIETLSYDVENFEYNVNGDTLEIYIDFGVRFEEKEIKPSIPEISEEELNSPDFDTVIPERTAEYQVDIEANLESEETSLAKENLTEIDTESFEPVIEEDAQLEGEERLEDMEKEIIMDSALDSDEFITYHVHIIREGETLETIASKYGTTVEIIKEYNSIESLELKAKLIIPNLQDE